MCEKYTEMSNADLLFYFSQCVELMNLDPYQDRYGEIYRQTHQELIRREQKLIKKMNMDVNKQIKKDAEQELLSKERRYFGV